MYTYDLVWTAKNFIWINSNTAKPLASIYLQVYALFRIFRISKVECQLYFSFSSCLLLPMCPQIWIIHIRLKYMLKASPVCVWVCMCTLVNVDFKHLMYLLGHEVGLNVKCWSGNRYFIILPVQCDFSTLRRVLDKLLKRGSFTLPV